MNASLKVRKVGNSLGVVLPKELIAQLKVGDGDSFFVSDAPDGSLRITPYDPEFEEQMKAAAEGMTAYRNTLRELAK
ncbi:MAG: AbrB/MazE/SpoVT family DNA-binding domain-containing protein [Pseudomonadota bacterium]